MKRNWLFTIFSGLYFLSTFLLFDLRGGIGLTIVAFIVLALSFIGKRVVNIVASIWSMLNYLFFIVIMISLGLFDAGDRAVMYVVSLFAGGILLLLSLIFAFKTGKKADDKDQTTISGPSDNARPFKVNNTPTFCPNCGSEVGKGKAFCGKCGNKLM